MGKKGLIKIEYKGKIYELFALWLAKRNRSFQTNFFDIDYIEKLHADIVNKNCEKSKEALIFLNADIKASMDKNFTLLEDLGVKVTSKQKKEIFSLRNANERDFISNNKQASEELVNFVNSDTTYTIGDMVTLRKNEKTKALKNKIPLNPKIEKQEKKEKIYPVKKLTDQALADFKASYKKGGK